jgi:HEAT repeat protein
MAKVGAPQGEDAPVQEHTAEDQAAIKAAGAWINLLSRTLKTCRLYDGGNPTVARFRDELHASLGHLTEEHGSLTFKITSDDVLYLDTSMYPPKARDDSLALPFYRDGIHAITFHPGVEHRETDALVDALIKVSGQNAGDDDLVTLLWEAQLNNIEMEYVPAEGDLGVSVGAEVASPLPWPQSRGGGDGESGGGGQGVTATDGGQTSRSDDWSTGDLTIEVEAAFAELEAMMAGDTQRFLAEHEAEHTGSLVDAAIAIANACLSSKLQSSDRDELARFLPRALRQSVGEGAWRQAAAILEQLGRCGSREWTAETFAQEILQPISISAAVLMLDQQDSAAVKDFIQFARALGEPAVDLLNLILGESKVRRTRRLLAEAVTDLCRANPERLAPWLADPRWYVVRNIIHILGWIGGPSIVGLLQTAARHPEPKVRHEVVSALGQLDLKLSRPLLIKMLDGATSRLFSLILHQLSTRRDSATARLLIGYLQDQGFEQRPIEEKRAIYSALSATGGDEILPELEAELLKGNWFTRTQETHRQAVARCIARIGSPAAKEILDRGAHSKRGAVRKACEDALAGVHASEDAPRPEPGHDEEEDESDD